MTSRTLPQVPHDEALGRSVLNHTQKSVLLYGLGVVGKRTFFDLQSLGITIEAILDGDTRLRGQSFEGVPIYAPEEFRGTSKPVIIASYVYYREICSQLNELRYEKLLPYFFYLSGSETDDKTYVTRLLEYARLKRQIEAPGSDWFELKSVDLTITEKCSLKCKDCANLMQYFKKPQNEKFEVCMKALNRFLQVVDHVNEIRILGGEPLVNPELARYITEIKACSKFSYIVVYTNATILPSEELLECMSDERVIVRLSDYGMERQKCGDLVSLLTEHGILCFVEKVSQWQDCGILKSYGRTVSENMDILSVCCMRKTPSIKNGRLFRCPYAGNMDVLSGCPPEISQFVDLLDSDMSDAVMRGKIRELMEFKHLYACDYCGGRPTGVATIPAALQTDKPLDYTMY